jgi:lantibiotic modifying enzyme
LLGLAVGGKVDAVADRGGVTDADAGRVGRQAFEWVNSVAVDVDDGGRGWLEDGTRFDDLYSGTAGVLLACAEATANGADVGTMAAGALARLRYLAARGPQVVTMPDDSLFSGWAGIAVALRAWSVATGDADAGADARSVAAQIADRILRTPDEPAQYTDVISGDAGLLLALLPDESDATIAAAHVLADRLVHRAEDGPSGPQWRMTASWEYLMPGFSHGTAGVAYALAAAGRRLDRPDVLDVATRAADGLVALGSTPDGWALPLAIPARPHGPAVNFGWCHGPTGTVRLFLLLDAIDSHPRWRQAVDACLRAVADSGLPARIYPGFWDNLARCCGTAGVGELFLDRYRDTGNARLLDWADVLAADVIGRAIVTSGGGVAWSNTEHTRNPSELPPEPGLMQGAAGIGGWLVRLDAAHHDRDAPPAPVGVEPSWL